MSRAPHTDAVAARPEKGRALAVAHFFVARRPWKLWAGVSLSVIALLTIATLLSPREQAQAVPADGVLGTGDEIEDAISGVTDWLSSPLEGAAVDGFKGIIGFLFGSDAKFTAGLLRWLVSINDFTSGGDAVGITRLEIRVQTLAFAVMSLIVTFAFLRFWLAGMSFSSTGLSGSLDVFGRGVLAIALIFAWPYAFKTLLALTNNASAYLLSNNLRELEALLTSVIGLGAGVVAAAGPFAGIIVAVFGLLMLIGLLLLKIMLIAVTHILFVAMPLALIVWPHPDLSWITKAVAGGLVTCLLVPIGWALIFASAAAMSFDSLPLTDDGSADLLTALIKPLVGLAMLAIAVRMPMMMLRMLPLGQAAPGNGMVARGLTHAASKQMGAGMVSNLADRAPGVASRLGMGPQTSVAESTSVDSQGRVLSRTDTTTRGTAARMTSAQIAASPAATAAGGAPGTPRTASKAMAAATEPGSGSVAAATVVAQSKYDQGVGLRTQDFTKPEMRSATAAEYSQSQARATSSPEATSQALGTFSTAQQEAIRETAGKSDNPRGVFAGHAADSGYTPAERDAFRVLAASAPGTLARHEPVAPRSAVPAVAGSATQATSPAAATPMESTPTPRSASSSESPSAAEVTSATVAAAGTAVDVTTFAAPAPVDRPAPSYEMPGSSGGAGSVQPSPSVAVPSPTPTPTPTPAVDSEVAQPREAAPSPSNPPTTPDIPF